MESNYEDSIAAMIQERILALSFPAYSQLVRRLLYHSGYSSIRAVGTGARRKTTGKGGLDLLAVAHTDLTTSLTAIQIKQYRHCVPRRFIDELRGTMLRVRAEQGLLIVTSRFSSTAKAAAAESEVFPVQLIDGAELVRMLMARRIGLKQDASDSGPHRWEFDADCFDSLQEQALKTLEIERACPGKRRRSAALPPEGRWP